MTRSLQVNVEQKMILLAAAALIVLSCIVVPVGIAIPQSGGYLRELIGWLFITDLVNTPNHGWQVQIDYVVMEWIAILLITGLLLLCALPTAKVAAPTGPSRPA